MNVEMNITTIREYQPTDKNAVIDLIRQNTPAYFAPKEEADFSNYLDSERELYFVLLLNKKVVGCGGINFTKDKASGKISWDIIHPQYQGKSLGAQLLKYRIEILKSIDAAANPAAEHELGEARYQDNGGDLKWSVASDGKYTLTVDLNQMRIYLNPAE